MGHTLALRSLVGRATLPKSKRKLLLGPMDRRVFLVRAHIAFMITLLVIMIWREFMWSKFFLTNARGKRKKYEQPRF